MTYTETIGDSKTIITIKDNLTMIPASITVEIQNKADQKETFLYTKGFMSSTCRHMIQTFPGEVEISQETTEVDFPTMNEVIKKYAKDYLIDSYAFIDLFTTEDVLKNSKNIRNSLNGIKNSTITIGTVGDNSEKELQKIVTNSVNSFQNNENSTIIINGIKINQNRPKISIEVPAGSTLNFK